jgi:hypothetical protein
VFEQMMKLTAQEASSTPASLQQQLELTVAAEESLYGGVKREEKSVPTFSPSDSQSVDSVGSRITIDNISQNPAITGNVRGQKNDHQMDNDLNQESHYHHDAIGDTELSADLSKNERLADPGEWKAKWDNLEDSIVQTSSVAEFITETRHPIVGSFSPIRTFPLLSSISYE